MSEHKKKNKMLFPIILSLLIVVAAGLGYYIIHSKLNNNQKPSNNISTSQNQNKSSSSDTNNSSNANNNSNSNNNQTQNTQTTTSLTKDQATTLINNYVLKKNPNAKCSYDHNQVKDNKNYYVIQARDNNSTLGWYYVEVETGKAYEWDLVDDTLNPIN